MRLDIPLDAVTSIDFESATFEGVEINIIFVDIKDAEKIVCTGICFPVDIPHARWVYDLLVHYGVWRKSEQTHH